MKADRIGLFTGKLYSKEDVQSGKVMECCKCIPKDILNNEDALKEYVDNFPTSESDESKCYSCLGCPKAWGC